MKASTTYGMWLIGAGFTFLGCGAARAPQELVDARTDYAAAAEGQTSKVAPAELHMAKTALDRAEREFKEEGNERKTRDLAYVAHRKVLYANALASLQATEQAKVNVLAEKRRREQERMADMSRTLDQTKDQLEAERTRAGVAVAENEAMKKLQEANAVRQEQRGTVITLSGAVLFASGKAEVLFTADDKLGDVAAALKDDQQGRIIIEGHTDAQGSEESNMALSRRRAESVLTRLSTQGIPRERMEAIGYGESRPIADNSTPEGRANNRRVEIVVKPKSEGLSQASP